MDLSEGFQQLLANAISFLHHYLVTAVVTFILALLLANAAAHWVKTRSQDRLGMTTPANWQHTSQNGLSSSLVLPCT